MGERDSTPEYDRDGYIPKSLLPFLPVNPSVRDTLMMSIGIILSTALGIAAVYLVHEWVGVALAAIGVAHFGVRYRSRANDRYYRRQREKEADKKSSK